MTGLPKLYYLGMKIEVRGLVQLFFDTVKTDMVVPN